MSACSMELQRAEQPLCQSGGVGNARDTKALHNCDYPVFPNGQNHWSAGPANKSKRAAGTHRDVRKPPVCGL